MRSNAGWMALATEKTRGSDFAVGVAAVVLTLAGWAAVPLFLKHFTHSIDAWTSNGWRYAFAALFWAPVMVIGMSKRRIGARLWRAALIPAAINCIGQVCFTEAHYHIAPGLLTFSLRIEIVCVAIGAFILFPVERVIVRSGVYIGGLALVLIGTIGVILFGQSSLDADHLFGVGLALISGVCFAGYGLSVRRCIQRAPILDAFSIISVYTALVMVVLMLVFGERAGAGAMDLSATQFVLLMISSLVGIALGHTFYYLAIQRLGVAVASGVIQLQPVVVAAFSFFLFNELLTSWQWGSGAVAIIGAMLMLSVQRMTRRRLAANESPAESENAPAPAAH